MAFARPRKRIANVTRARRRFRPSSPEAIARATQGARLLDVLNAMPGNLSEILAAIEQLDRGAVVN